MRAKGGCGDAGLTNDGRNSWAPTAVRDAAAGSYQVTYSLEYEPYVVLDGATVDALPEPSLALQGYGINKVPGQALTVIKGRAYMELTSRVAAHAVLQLRRWP